ncbi:hypothetical protein QJS10_CPB04g01253 [Acorus calamus]|uniref:Uncharacterized protein n=1 Tax=Acorus calamus TaxID=4465 RepID=A0AAV9F4H4_ACOCL|nr:hypothetical protein QJS10_CPB04g01253 [Acorus calamus]
MAISATPRLHSSSRLRVVDKDAAGKPFDGRHHPGDLEVAPPMQGQNLPLASPPRTPTDQGLSHQMETGSLSDMRPLQH